MYGDPQKREEKSYNWVWWVIGIVAVIWFMANEGNKQELARSATQTAHPTIPPRKPTRAPAQGCEYNTDPSGVTSYDCLPGYGDRRDEELPPDYDMLTEIAGEQGRAVVIPIGTPSGCPRGCTYHPAGCDIKGNISFTTKEKIYHVRGQEYYDETVIDTAYGERWFCTEAEAKANGWRKALN